MKAPTAHCSAASNRPAPELALLSGPAASAALDPDRRRLLDAIREQPDSAAGLARRLGEKRQRLNYHLKALEQAGLLTLAEERRRGNCTERVLELTARHFLIDPTALPELAPEPDRAQDRFSATSLVSLTARAAGEVARLIERAESTGKRLATMSIETRVELESPASLQPFAEDLAEAVAEVVARYSSGSQPGRRPFRLILGAYPAPSEHLSETNPVSSPQGGPDEPRA